MKLAAIAAALVAGSALASESLVEQTCVFYENSPLVCAHIFEADLVLDSQPAGLTEPVGIGFARVGYVDSTTGVFVPVIETHYVDRFITVFPWPPTLLLVPNDEWISSGGFEGEYAHPLR